MNVPTYEQMRDLCLQVENLLTASATLRDLYTNRPQALDRFNHLFPPAQNPQQQAIRAQAEPVPRGEFNLDDFLIVARRPNTFATLFYQIEIIRVRTEEARNYFTRQSQYSSRLLFDLQRWTENFTDHEDLARKVDYYHFITTRVATLFD